MKKVLIAGGSGLIGKELIKACADKNYEVAILSRSNKSINGAKVIQWDLKKGTINGDISSYDYIINLTGAGIADKPWTTKRKKVIIDSRVQSADLLKKTLTKSGHRPKAIINASAIGYYGDSGDTVLTENSPIQTKEFLSEVCDLWERAGQTLESVTSRLVILRIGTVLSDEGGALDKMVPPIKLGMASYLGSGKQWMSWVHIKDITKMMIHFIEHDNTQGIYNGVSPNPMTNKEFTKVLKKVINRFALVLPAPTLAIKTIFGELSRLVLNSNRVSAEKVMATGFEFSFPDLESALRELYD